MSDHTTSLSPRPLSPRHERFVAEYLKDGNATRAYIRAGYAPRAAQTCGSRLLRDPRIEAAIAAGRQRITESLQVSVERVTQEYAKIAFASVDDFVSTDDDGHLRIDLEKANPAQRAGLVELRIRNHSKQEQSVVLKLGKLQALAALNKQLGAAAAAAAAKPADRFDFLAESMQQGRLRHLAEARAERAEQALAEARAAQPPVDAIGPAAPPLAAEPEEPRPPIVREGLGLVDTPATHQQMPGMPTPPPAFRSPGLYPDDRIVWVRRDRSADPPEDHDPYMMTCEYDTVRYGLDGDT